MIHDYVLNVLKMILNVIIDINYIKIITIHFDELYTNK